VFAQRAVVSSEGAGNRAAVIVLSADATSDSESPRALIAGGGPWFSSCCPSNFIYFDFQDDPVIVERFVFSYPVLAWHSLADALEPAGRQCPRRGRSSAGGRRTGRRTPTAGGPAAHQRPRRAASSGS